MTAKQKGEADPGDRPQAIWSLADKKSGQAFIVAQSLLAAPTAGKSRGLGQSPNINNFLMNETMAACMHHT